MTAGTFAGAREPANRTLIYLARHGQTPLNESGVLRGLADPPLDEAGQRQARRLGARAGSPRADSCYRQPATARQADPATGSRAGRLQVVTDQCLLDRDYGQWTGTSRDMVAGQWGTVDRAPGVEPRSAVTGRAVSGLTDVARRCLGGGVVVSHDAVNRQVLAAFGAGLDDPDTIPQDNGCFNTLEWRSDTWTVLSINELPAKA